MKFEISDDAASSRLLGFGGGWLQSLWFRDVCKWPRQLLCAVTVHARRRADRRAAPAACNRAPAGAADGAQKPYGRYRRLGLPTSCCVSLHSAGAEAGGRGVCRAQVSLQCGCPISCPSSHAACATLAGASGTDACRHAALGCLRCTAGVHCAEVRAHVSSLSSDPPRGLPLPPVAPESQRALAGRWQGRPQVPLCGERALRRHHCPPVRLGTGWPGSHAAGHLSGRGRQGASQRCCAAAYMHMLPCVCAPVLPCQTANGQTPPYLPSA